MSDKPKGYFSKLLVMDCETSGLAFKNYDPSIEPDGREYQAVSWGLAVVDSTTFKVIDTLYVEIKYNGLAIWSERAEAVHQMSKEYLEEKLKKIKETRASRAAAFEEMTKNIGKK